MFSLLPIPFMYLYDMFYLIEVGIIV